MNPLPRLCLCALGLLLASAAWSQTQEPRLRRVYGNLSLGESSMSAKGDAHLDDDPILGTAVGYRLNPNFAVEAFWRQLSFRFRLFDELLGDTNTYPTEHYGVAAVGTLPLAEQFGLYGRAGLGRTTMDAATGPQTHFHIVEPSVGVGLALGFSRAFGMKLETTRFTRSDVTTTMLVGELRF